ncbi:MAG: hypothetical protein JW829_11100 [Pirellulales bacterium]|nr:hypothetical protein [Pirellulales bacterium]
MSETSTSSMTSVDLPTGLVRWDDPDKETGLAEVLDRLCKKFTPLLMANFRLAGEELPEWLNEEDDLLSGSPDKLLKENSLHVIAVEEIPAEDLAAEETPEEQHAVRTAKLLSLHDAVRKKSAGLLLFGKASKDEVLAAIRFHRGFYCTAKGLEMFLNQGSKDLASASHRAGLGNSYRRGKRCGVGTLRQSRLCGNGSRFGAACR